jgi:signal peptidase II
MLRQYRLLLVIAATVIFWDQLTKLYVDAVMLPHQSVTVIENFFDITYIRNPGGVFGIFAQVDRAIMRPLLLSLSSIAVVVIIVIYHTTPLDRVLARVAFSLILGGAIGNLIDRIRFDGVIDFLDFHWYQYHWPAFNVADAAITIGVGLLFWELLFGKSAKG